MAKGTRDSGLGRGLSALLGEAALEPEQKGVTRLPIEKVQPNGAQPRKFFPLYPRYIKYRLTLMLFTFSFLKYGTKVQKSCQAVARMG